MVKMDGGVTVTQGNLKLTSDRAELDRSTNKARLYGDVTLHQPGTRITGSAADVTTTNSFGNVIDATMLEYASGARVTATKLTRRKESVIELDQAKYTRCPPDKEDWVLSSNHVRLNRETGRGEAKSTVIRVGDVPVFYTPYMNFPIDDRRQTGFLWPSIATTSGSSGVDVSVPYYLNIAPNLDATIAPRPITDRGTMFEGEVRYMNRFSNWQVNGSQLNSDDQTGEDRWFMAAKQNGQLNSYISTAIDYNRVSDADYLHDFSVSSLSIKRQISLNQAASVNLNYGNWFSSLAVQQYQTIDPLINEPYRQKPRFTFGRAPTGKNFELDYSLLTELTVFDHEDANIATRGGPWVTGNRLYLEPGISFPMRWTSSYFDPEVRLRTVSYKLDQPDAFANTRKDDYSTTVPQAILDAGVFFDREMMLGDDSFLQTLEPRLYYLYSPYKKQIDQPLFDTSALTFDYHQLFQPRRFIGHDRLEDFNQASAGVTSRIIEDRTGRELGHASIGQIFYFEDRRVNTLSSEVSDDLANSAVAAQLALQPVDSLWATTNVLWDADKNDVQQGNMYIHYEPKDRAIFNVGYRYNQSNPEISTLSNGIRQADASVAWPINNNWRVFLRLNYDLDLKSSLEDLVGLEYEDCCWLTRIVYQRAVFGDEMDDLGRTVSQRDSAILFEFQLKGLGGLGRRVETARRKHLGVQVNHDHFTALFAGRMPARGARRGAPAAGANRYRTGGGFELDQPDGPHHRHRRRRCGTGQRAAGCRSARRGQRPPQQTRNATARPVPPPGIRPAGTR
jgi:LPS-assembly protein